MFTVEDLIPVIIVEDDRIILEDVVGMLDWEKEGFQIVATATNGKLGCNAYVQYHPQLVITDIQMPVMDGLAMMRQLRHVDKNLSFLILSSYSEFEYAKEAVRLGTDSYLLKTELSPQLLLETLAPIREKIFSRQSMHRFTSQHQLFALISRSVDPGIQPIPSREEISAAFASYLRLNSQYKDCRQQLQWIIRECYSVLGIASQSQTCPDGTSKEIEVWVLDEYEKLHTLYQFIFVQKTSPTIINACRYIEQNYSDHQLQISTVANYVGLSSSRLSVLFKQELNQTVNDYITNTRIEAAKQLLRSGAYKVYEVSELVGYKTSQYFSQLFFQRTGCSPTEYQRGSRP